MQYPSKFQRHSKRGNKKVNPKVHMEVQKTQISHAILRKNINTGVSQYSAFKLSFRPIVTKQHDASTKTGMYSKGIEDSKTHPQN
jgi:hypothetical protein